MKQKLQSYLVTGLIFLSGAVSAQTQVTGTNRSKDAPKTAKTYLDLMVNVVSTSINYGGSNSSVTDFRKSANGIQAGASFQAGITPAFSVVSEFYFIRKGGKLKTGNPLTTSESELRLNTLELPLLARFHAGRFYVNAGPSIAYTLSGKSETGHASTKISFNNSVDGFKRFDAGVQIGGGVEFPFRQRRIALDIRYCHGLTNISSQQEIYNRAIMISVHFSKAWRSNPLGRK